jgi:hypothetical protein
MPARIAGESAGHASTTARKSASATTGGDSVTDAFAAPEVETCCFPAVSPRFSTGSIPSASTIFCKNTPENQGYFRFQAWVFAQKVVRFIVRSLRPSYRKVD